MIHAIVKMNLGGGVTDYVVEQAVRLFGFN